MILEMKGTRAIDSCEYEAVHDLLEIIYPVTARVFASIIFSTGQPSLKL